MAPKSRFFESAKNWLEARPTEQLDISLVGFKSGKHMATLSRFCAGNPYNGSPQKKFRLEGALGPPRPEFRDQVKVFSFLFFTNIIFLYCVPCTNLKMRTHVAFTL